MIKLGFWFAFISLALAAYPNGSTEWNDYCFFYKTDLTQFAASEVACKKLSGHLASIADGFTNAVITLTDFWIGANTLSNPNVWSWTDGSSFNFTEWAAGEPQNLTGQSCAALSIDHGSWSAQDCFKLKPYVCAISKTPTPPAYVKCPMGWIYYQPTHSCFGLSYSTPLTPGLMNVKDWTSAEELCRNFSAHLLSFHDQDEYNMLQTYVQYTWTSTWTGIRSDDGTVTWKNSDDTPADFLPWYAQNGYPIPMSNSCVYSGYNVLLNADCNAKFPFVCKRSAY